MELVMPANWDISVRVTMPSLINVVPVVLLSVVVAAFAVVADDRYRNNEEEGIIKRIVENGLDWIQFNWIGLNLGCKLGYKEGSML
jgi:hypothetical protein